MKLFKISLLGIALLALGSTSLKAQGTVSVEGTATSYDIPNAVTVTLFVSLLEGDADDAYSSTEKATRKIVQELQETKGISKVAVGNMSIKPAFDNEEKKKAFRSYQELSFTLDSLPIYEEVTEDIIDEGAAGMLDVRPTINNLESIEGNVLRKAVSAARVKAQAMADGAGRGLGEIIHMEILEREGPSIFTVEMGTEFEGRSLSKVATSRTVRIQYALR